MDYLDRIIEKKDIERLVNEGYKPFDPHLHTSASYDVFPVDSTNPKNLFEKMNEQGFGYITFTDHNTLRAYEQLEDHPKLVKGIEMTIKPKQINGNQDTYTLHVNVYDLSNKQKSDLEVITHKRDFYLFIDYLKSNDLPHMLNHPTWTEFGESPDWNILPDIIKEFSVVEAYNHGRTENLNKLTFRLAKEYSKGVVSSSDNHFGKPEKSTLVKGGDFRESWEYIKNGESLIVPNNLSVQYLIGEAHEWLSQWKDANYFDIEHKYCGLEVGHSGIDAFLGQVVHKKIHNWKPLKSLHVNFLRSILNNHGERIIKNRYISNQNKQENKIISNISGDFA